MNTVKVKCKDGAVRSFICVPGEEDKLHRILGLAKGEGTLTTENAPAKRGPGRPRKDASGK